MKTFYKARNVLKRVNADSSSVLVKITDGAGRK
jgi:hypothetical protein